MPSPPSFDPASLPATTADTPTLPLDPADVVRLLLLVSEVSALRENPRAWRLKLFAQLPDLFHSGAAAALVLSLPAHATISPSTPTIVSCFDADASNEPGISAFLHEFNRAPFRSLFFRQALARFASRPQSTFTTTHRDLLGDAPWESDLRQTTDPAGNAEMDCLLSLQAAATPGILNALLLFRLVPHAPGAGGPTAAPFSHFTPYQRTLLHVLHQGLQRVYRADEAHGADAVLRPRLRQTLERLIAGDSERQAAAHLALSVHTVHDYVKELYLYFGVSSRRELLSKWIKSGGQPPPAK